MRCPLGQTLQPGNEISHYRIIGPLGTGGMGEVYLAHDLTLERNVAVKVLPPELVRNEERVRRFILEAKSASSLSHPNIVTIHEIGCDRVRTGETEDPANDTTEPVHFISMELISGETLKEKIHHEKTDLRTLLGYMAQAAEGLAKAHASGIVHRDLKPGNIMVTKDGFTKVLDFGLAKLTERHTGGGDTSTAPTELGDLTGAGIVGTAGYMSPEQIRGKTVDHRSDIFSFGCILHEAAARQRPFSADTDVEVMTKILNEKPPALEEINPKVPAELRRLIRRCLAKSPDQRSQSIKDIAIELREIVDEYDTLSPSGTSASSVRSGVTLAAPARRTGLYAGIAAAILTGIGGIAVGIYGWRGGTGSTTAPAEPFQSMRMTSLISEADLQNAVLSPDGRYLAYVVGSEGQWSVTVRQVATGSSVVVIAPQRTPLRGLSFSPDGNYLYYLGRDPETPLYSSLFEIPSLGGAARKRAFDVDSAVAFSPDGKQVCFVRGVTKVNETHVVILDLSTGSESVLAVIKPPTVLPLLRPAWSPDGERVAVEVVRTQGGIRGETLVIDVKEGRQTAPDRSAWLSLSDAEWIDNGALVIAGGSLDTGLARQIFRLSWPDGGLSRITNDLNDYQDISVSADGKTIAAVRNSNRSDLWIAPATQPGSPRQLTRESGGKQLIARLATAQDGSIVYLVRTGSGTALQSMGTDGSPPRQITPEGAIVMDFHLIPGGRGVVVSLLREDKVPHLWRLDLDGGNLTQLTTGSGEIQIENAGVSADAKWMLYRPTEALTDVWKAPVAGGTPSRIPDARNIALFSPDSRLIAGGGTKDVGERTVPTLIIMTADTHTPIAEFIPPPRSTNTKWLPDSSGLAFVDEEEGVRSIISWSIASGRKQTVLSFPEGRIADFRWSPDGKEILFTATRGESQNLWKGSVATGKTTPLTDFRDGIIFHFDWTPDTKNVVMTQGKMDREVVLIRGFQ